MDGEGDGDDDDDDDDDDDGNIFLVDAFVSLNYSLFETKRLTCR
jgi:hypothetical protein|tara:strand:+ start:229 stop:360 length:132 start_codon:yes stop_codon:yes gene_type:complete